MSPSAPGRPRALGGPLAGPRRPFLLVFVVSLLFLVVFEVVFFFFREVFFFFSEKISYYEMTFTTFCCDSKSEAKKLSGVTRACICRCKFTPKTFFFWTRHFWAL